MMQMEMHHIGLALNGILERITMDFVIMQKGEPMSDYIDRQAAIDALAKAMPTLTTPDGCGEFDHEIQIADEAFVDAMNVIHNMPSADAVEVVRCKDCKHYRDYGCQRAFVYPKPDDFCSYGERADG